MTALAGAGIAYGFRFVPADGRRAVTAEMVIEDREGACAAVRPGIDYRDWLIFGEDGMVTAFTGRTELGQGLRTVLYAVLTQGLELPLRRIRVVQGDTDLCPDDGPTSGSCATRYVGWGFWLACERIREDLVERGSALLGLDPADARYRAGSIESGADPATAISAFDLKSEELTLLTIDPTASAESGRAYGDRDLDNVNAGEIVTGRLEYVGDRRARGALYGAFLSISYHNELTSLLGADIEAALRIGGVVSAGILEGEPYVLAESFHALQQGLGAIEAEWKRPARSRKLSNEEEILSGAELVEVVEERGDVEAGFARSAFYLEETYSTQYATQCPIETDSALADVDSSGTTVWAATQYPTRSREMVAKALGVEESKVRIVSMPVGGGYGGKLSSPVVAEAALLSRLAGRPVKYIYSRFDQFVRRSHFKESCVHQLATGVDADGKIIARRIDLHQDKGKGSTGVYRIPNVLTRLYQAEMPTRHAVSRGTSYVQTCFALESHMDMVAAGIGANPLAFRRANVGYPAFRELIDLADDTFGYSGYSAPRDHALGAALLNHADDQLAAAVVEISLDRGSGAVSVERVCLAVDIGIVINRRLATANLRGAVMWGIGYALMEEIVLDGHRCHTVNLIDYNIPRFQHLPEIEIRFSNTHKPAGGPRGCGEMAVIPTIGAIANAVYDASGIRFYSTPITPEKLLEALG